MKQAELMCGNTNPIDIDLENVADHNEEYTF